MKRGRPALPEDKKRQQIGVRTSPSLKASLEAAAAQNGRSVAQEAEWRLQRSFEDTARGVLYWTATLVALPPKDGNWSLFVAKDYDGAGFLAWSAEDGEWVEPDCRNTGYDDEYLRRSESVWTPAPNWMPIEPAW